LTTKYYKVLIYQDRKIAVRRSIIKRCSSSLSSLHLTRLKLLIFYIQLLLKLNFGPLLSLICKITF